MSLSITKNENNTYYISWTIVSGGNQILFNDSKVTNLVPWKNLYESILAGESFELDTDNYSIRSGGSVGNGTLYFGYNSSDHISAQTQITQKILDDLKKISYA